MELARLLHLRDDVEPSSVINDRNHGAYVIVAGILCLILSVLFVVARLIVRWPSKATLGRDDYVAPIALALSIVQSILVMVDVPVGLGRPSAELGSATAATVLEMLYASDLLFVLSLCAGRLAVGLFLARLSTQQKQGRTIGLVTAACCLYGLASFLLVAIRKPSSTSTNMLPRWIAVSAMGSTLDLAIAIYPIVLVWGLKMKPSSRLTVVTGFALRLPIIAISAIRVHSFSRLGPDSDYTFKLAQPAAWGQLEMHYNLVAAIIPCLRLFLRVWDTHQLANLTWFDGDPADLRATGPTISDPLSQRPPPVPRACVPEKDSLGISVSHTTADHRG